MSEKWTADRVMASRNQAKGRAALEQIAATVPEAKLELAELELSSLDSVREFAATSAISPSPAS